jgi:hypothetical protein
MDQFLSAMRGLEGVKTPLSVETPTLTADTPQQTFDPNSVEMEEMGVRQESLRRSKVRQLSKAQRGQTKT